MITEIFYHIDIFCEGYEKQIKTHLIKKGNSGTKRGPKQNMILSEIMTIVILFHHSKFRTFKDFYFYLKTHHKTAFNSLVSYNRFVELQKQVLVPLMLFLSISCSNDSSDIHFIDSTSLKVCHNKRIYSHKTFKDIAKRGMTSVGWFYGFKLHLVINPNGRIAGFHITPGNVADNNPKVVKKITQNIFGKLFGDKGYLSKKLFVDLYQKGLTLITKVKKNMENKLMDFYDKILLKKRGIIESVNNVLKNVCMIEHSRHRSIANFFVNIFSALSAYSFIENKPSIKCIKMPLIENL
ncbi:MAG: IS982 family transposase [bacterium]